MAMVIRNKLSVGGSISKRDSIFRKEMDSQFLVTGPQNLTMTYNANGNISTKSDIGATAFSYGASAGPYALTGLTSTTAVIPATNQTATYNSFEKISALTEGVYGATFIYNADQQRAKMDVTQSGTNILTRFYAGSSDMREISGGVTKEYAYIGGDAYSAPVVAVNTYCTIVYYYLLRDYLGNITHVYNASTSAVQEYSFDAWGRRRNPTDWSYNLTGQPDLFAGRGFTSHEFLSQFNLYNMNGRMYDPLVGRFLSADNYIQDPTSTQNYNRYSYCLNNPLKYTDVSGMMMAENTPESQAIFWAFQESSSGESYWNSGSGGGGGGASLSNWFSGYTQLRMNGYTGDVNDYLNQINSPDYNGTVANHYFTYENYTDKKGEATVKGIRHDVVIKPRNTTLVHINDGLNATGIVAGGAEIFTGSNASEKIAYTTINGVSATVSSEAVETFFHVASKDIFYGMFFIDVSNSLFSDQLWGKTFVNSVFNGAAVWGGTPGLIIGIGYTVIDKTGAFDLPAGPMPPYNPSNTAMPDATRVTSPIIKY